MARRSVNVTLTEKEMDHLLSHYGLDAVLEEMIHDPQVDELYEQVVEFETRKNPRTMRKRIKKEYRPLFKDFADFEDQIRDFLKCILISEFLKESVSYPFKGRKKIAKRLAKRKAEILEWSLSYSKADLASTIAIALMNRGYQPL